MAVNGTNTVQVTHIEPQDLAKAVTVSVDGKSYDAKAATVGEYHVLTAVDQQSGGSCSGWTQFIIVSITCACLAIIGCIVVFVAGKSKDK